MKKLILLIVIISLFSTLYAENWTKWRGPNANGTSNETNWNPEGLQGSPDVLWEAIVGKGHSQSAVNGDKLYTSGTVRTIAGNDTTFEDIIYCLESETGDEIWRYSYPSEEISYPGIRTSPVIDGINLYTLSSLGDLICFNSNSGKVLWKKNLTKDFQVVRPSWGFSGSAVIHKDLLLLSSGESGIALNKKTGKAVWNSDTKKEAGLSSPYLFEYKGKTLAIISETGKIHCVDVENGEKKWSYKYDAQNDPIFYDGKIFLSGDYREGVTLLKLTDGEPEVVWTEKNMRGGFQNKVIVGDYVYGFASVRNKDELHCLNLTNGKLMWHKNLGAQWGALMAANGKLIIVSGMGEVMIAEASSTEFKMISSANVVSMNNNEGIQMNKQCHCWIDPILVNGKIYIRNNYGNLACVDLSI